MSRPSRIVLAILLATGLAWSDLVVAIPAAQPAASTLSQIGADTASTGARAIRSLSGATYTIGKGSTGQLTETDSGELSLSYSLKYVAADGSYGTKARIVLPLTPTWEVKDLSSMSSITYRAKMATSGAKIHLIIGSDAYFADMAAEGSALTSNDVALSPVYTTITVLPGDLLVPTWSKVASAANTGWIADGTTYTTGIAPAVKSFEFEPVTNWASATELKVDAASTNTLTIRDVRVVIPGGYPLQGSGCTGKYFVLDDFSTATGRVAGDANYFNTYWYAYTDTTSNSRRNDTDSAVGKSWIEVPAGKKVWTWTANAAAIITAHLEKNDTGSAFLFHPKAGWAGIGTDLTTPEGLPGDFDHFASGNVLTGISFDLYAGAPIRGVLANPTFDTDLVKLIRFKVGAVGVPDEAAFQVGISSDSAVLGWDGSGEGLWSYCVDIARLAQPASYVRDELGGVSTPLPIDKLTRLLWEVKIDDESDPTKHKATATYAVANVLLWGVDSCDLSEQCLLPVRNNHSREVKKLSILHRGGVALSYALPGERATIEVVRLDGTRVVRFEAGAREQNLSLPTKLSRGNYVVMVTGSGRRFAAKVSVAD
jgi:hypothetical protein